jgi:hypothetical protein
LCLLSERRSVVAEGAFHPCHPCHPCCVSRQLLNRPGPQREAWHVTGGEKKRNIMCCCPVLLPLAPRPAFGAVVIGLSGRIRDIINPHPVTCHAICYIEFDLLYERNLAVLLASHNAREVLNVEETACEGLWNHAVMLSNCTSMTDRKPRYQPCTMI